ncbi:MAG: LamG-like jellyroll fold domain-containing protein, partial [Verrucomicrobiota bacterium]
DNSPPAIDCPSNITVNTHAGSCETNVVLASPVTSDNCLSGGITLDGVAMKRGFASGINGGILGSGNNKTIEFWFRKDAGSSGVDQLVALGGAVHIGFQLNNSVLEYISGGFVNVTGYTVTDTDWHHFAIAYSGGTTRLYVDGVQVGTAGFGHGAALLNDLYVGADPTFGERAEGDFDDVRVWNTQRSMAQIQANMNMPLTGNEAGLVHYYTLDEGTGTTAADSADGADMTMENFVDADWINPGAPALGAVAVSNNLAGPYGLGTNVVTWTATDPSGNSNTCTQLVVVVDNEAPMITCPTNIVTTNDIGQCEAAVSFSASATDNCDTNVDLVCNFTNNHLFPVGTSVVNCVATDDAGNTNTCMFNVVVNDTEPPMITCPTNTITTTNDPGVCGAVVSYSASATDNCDTNVDIVCAPTNNHLFPVGTTMVNCVATDDAGNTSTCMFNVVVNDVEPPTITCPSNITVNTHAGSCETNLTIAAPAVADNCFTPSFALDLNGGPEHVVSSTNVVLSGAAARTLEFWFRRDSAQVGGIAHVINWGTDSPGQAFGFFLDAVNELRFYGKAGGFDYGTGATLDTNWHHLAVTYDGADVRTYLDGAPTPTPSAARLLNTDATPLFVGTRFELSEFTRGEYAEIRIWNTARSQAEISANLGTRLTGSESGLVHYYPFNDGPGNATATDEAGGNDATLTNMDPATESG